MKKSLPTSGAVELSVGEIAARSGMAVSVIHYYESRGLIKGRRSPGNQRRYSRGVCAGYR
jgi:MerR family redox-sensitive transcriptional activator SoxR